MELQRHTLEFSLSDFLLEHIRSQPDTENVHVLTAALMRAEASLRGKAIASPSPYWFSIQDGTLSLTFRRGRGHCHVEGNQLTAYVTDPILAQALAETLARLPCLLGQICENASA